MNLVDGTEVQVQLTRDRFAELELSPDEEIFLTPREMRRFQDAIDQ